MRKAVIFVLVSAGSIGLARADGNSNEDHETLIRYAGYFANCVHGNAINHHDELHKVIMLGGDVRASLILDCDPIANGYLHWCSVVGHDEKSCYGDLNFIVDDVLHQIGN